MISFLLMLLLIVFFSGNAPAQIVDIPPGDNTLPYTPADGSTVSVNPPPFIWVPSGEAVSYRLEVSRSKGFNTGSDIARESDVSTIALSRELSRGAWYWRYTAELKNGSKVTSKVRKFEIPENAYSFPFPDIQKAVDAIPRNRPRLFIPRAKLSAKREWIANARSRDLEILLRNCRGYFGEELVPEPPYVTGEGAERGKNYQQIFRTTRPPMDKMETCALAYLLTGDRECGEEAKRRLLHFFSWDPEGSTSYTNNDEPAMWVMMRGTRAYDWTWDLFGEEEREQVEACMRIRAAQFYDHLKNRRRFHTNPYESHAGRTLGFLGEVSLSFIHEWPEAEEYLRYVLTLFWNAYPAWGKEDGGWHEGPSYWSYYMGFALHFVVPLREMTDIDLMRKPFFRNTPYYKLYTNPPYARISPFGDQEQSPPNASMGQLMYWFGRLVGEPGFLWYAEDMKAGPGRSIIGFLVGDPDAKGAAPLDLPQARHFPGVGLVSMHTALGDGARDVHLLFHSDPYGAISHAHADQNAFTLEAYGEALAIASGFYPWYGSDHHKNWSWHSRSSNTITFDNGEGQVIRSSSSKGEITAFHHDMDFDFTVGDATRAYGGKLDKCLRSVLHLRDGIFLIFDEIESEQARSFEWRLHAWDKMAIDTRDKSVTIARGDARLVTHLFSPDDFTFAQTDSIPWPPEHGEGTQWHLTASLVKPAASCRFLAALIPYENGDRNIPVVELKETDYGIVAEVRVEERTWTAVFRDSDARGQFDCNGLVSDGTTAVVKRQPGKTPIVFQHGGTYVSFSGE